MQGETERGSAGGALIWAVLDVPGAELVTDRPLIGYSSCSRLSGPIRNFQRPSDIHIATTASESANSSSTRVADSLDRLPRQLSVQLDTDNNCFFFIICIDTRRKNFQIFSILTPNSSD